mmetsp:Transcript_105198/g.166056  ORF Transcript_105198/g.166056 Transcript_105198/m.166056 type:complete len:375 (-) Transcript_105198:171-1295(-)|eukprot:CAMPEP_0169079354 /NCGR_PEP_ID=MMETSP1015-20121227/9903_1 /TAXON_ID=342587 /ORGANISM="Karlodinium micrum, Strain CCMP2283" /LENGTH=374 /DNA_ID=CAMNT_0009139011 /DNA_START=84 /DNA_END=1208 /DNA_ORIENTATION=+
MASGEASEPCQEGADPGGQADDSGAPDDEDCGEDEGYDDDDGVVWEEMLACPLIVRFTQDKIHPFFYRRGQIKEVVPKIQAVYHSGDEEPLGVNQAEIARGGVVELKPPFGPIHCLRKGKDLWSLDNRRLYALQYKAMDLWPQQCCVRLLASDRLARKKFKSQYRKFNTQTAGQIVHITAKFRHFDTWHWFDKAIEIEQEYTISRQLERVMTFFEALPVIGALLFRTGLTGLTSRVPLIVAFILTFVLDFIRQKVPACEKKIAALHVKAIMDGDIKYCPSCGSREADNYDSSSNSVSAPQLAATMALLMVLTLPYVLAIPHDKMRSSVLSCWLGITCVLVVQLIGILRTAGRPIEALASGPDDDECTASPKHRD